MRRSVLAAAVGALATALAVALLVAPDAVRVLGPLDAAVTALRSRDPRVLLLAVSVVVGLLGFAVSRGRPRRERRGSGPARLTGADPETAAADDRVRPGEGLDGQLALAADGDGTAERAVRETLRTHAVRRVAAERGIDAGPAQAAVDDGTWTEDGLAAAYLGTGPLPLSARLRAWLDPAAEQRRRVERAVAAIEGVGER